MNYIALIHLIWFPIELEFEAARDEVKYDFSIRMRMRFDMLSLGEG